MIIQNERIQVSFIGCVERNNLELVEVNSVRERKGLKQKKRLLISEKGTLHKTQ